MVKSPWKTISSQTTTHDRFTITNDEVELSNQEMRNFSYINFADGICVLAITREEKVLVLDQYRHAVQSWELEFPAGMIDANEEPESAAERELLEETGYQSNLWTSLGKFYPSPGSTSETIHLFLANDCYKVSEPTLESSEEIELKLVPVENFFDLVQNESFKHGAGLACWAKYLSFSYKN